MSVILNALRSRDTAKTTSDKIRPREGLFFGAERSSTVASPTRVSILVIILFAAGAFAFVRLTAQYFAPPLVATPVVAPKIVSVPLSDLKLPEPKVEAVMDLNNAKALFAQNRLDESLAAYEKLLKANPSDAMLLNDMGLILLKQDHVLEAESRMRDAIAKDPNCAECYNNLGLVATQAGRVVDAEKHLKMAISLKKTYPDPYFNLGVLLEKSGNEKAAIAQFEEFLKVTPDQNAPIAVRVKNHIAKLSESQNK